jgi:hypothetical protein
MAPVSFLPKAPESGLNSDINISNVSTTTIWATTLFPLFMLLDRSKRITPAKTGINAVTEGVSDPKYPKRPTITKTDALIELIRYGFINKFLCLLINPLVATKFDLKASAF